MVYSILANSDGTVFQTTAKDLSDILLVVKCRPNMKQYQLLYNETANVTDSEIDWHIKLSVYDVRGSKECFIKDVEHLISIGF